MELTKTTADKSRLQEGPVRTPWRVRAGWGRTWGHREGQTRLGLARPRWLLRAGRHGRPCGTLRFHHLLLPSTLGCGYYCHPRHGGRKLSELRNPPENTQVSQGLQPKLGRSLGICTTDLPFSTIRLQHPKTNRRYGCHHGPTVARPWLPHF